MTHVFRPAAREGVQLIIGLAGASGAGKSYSLFQLATGLAYPEATNADELAAIIASEGRNRIACIDTERGRALHYAPPPGERADPWRRDGAWFAFDHCAMEPPFSPDAYSKLVEAADDAGYRAIIVDSFSHEWAGEGGVLEQHEAEQYAAAKRKANYGGGDKEPGWKELEAVKMTAWIKPKMAHKKMIGRITTLRAHLLIGLRAEQKVKMTEEKQANGYKKTVIVSAADLPPCERWTPVCEKAFPFELTVSFVLGPEAPGFPHILKLQDQHRAFVDLSAPLSSETGRALAAWAGGSTGAVGSTSGATKAKVTPEDWTESYIAGLKRCADRDALLEYQGTAANTKAVATMREKYPELHKKIVAAQSERFAEINAADDDDDDDQGVDDDRD